LLLLLPVMLHPVEFQVVLGRGGAKKRSAAVRQMIMLASSPDLGGGGSTCLACDGQPAGAAAGLFGIEFLFGSVLMMCCC